MTVLLGAAVLVIASPARGQDAVARVNGVVAATPGTKDATAELFPALAAMTPPPDEAASPRGVSQLKASSPDFAAWRKWAEGQPQQDALKTLRSATDPKNKPVLALPYGRAGVAQAWLDAGLYVDLGKPELVAAAPSGARYMERIVWLATLSTVEAERLAADGKPDECADVLIAWFRLGRMMADRAFFDEKAWGYEEMLLAMERMLDIACLHPDLFTEKQVKVLVDALDVRAVAPERIRFPIGEKIALEQLTEMTIAERGEVKREVFGAIMARLAGGDRPLSAFSEAGRWSKLAERHAGWFDSREKVQGIFGDWEKRWDLNNPFDPLMETATDYSKMDKLKFSAVERLAGGMETMFVLRMDLATYMGGTRSALGVVGYKSAFAQWPPNLPAVQPRFVPRLDNDPWFFEEAREVRQHFTYFVPMRDQRVADRELPKPHEITVGGARLSGQAALAALTNPLNAERLGLDLLRGFAAEVYDSKTGAVDAAKLKERWLAAAKTKQIEPQILPAVEQGMRMMATLSPEQIGAAMTQMMEMPGVAAQLESGAARLGLTVADAKQFLAKLTSMTLQSPGHKEVVEAVAGGQTLTRELYLKAFEAGIEEMTKPELVEPYIRTILAKFASAGPAAASGSVIELTDKEFVLYSVGPNERPEWARQVGEGGTDIIIWPPLLNLERRLAGGN
ncbi:MAG: hypothetical protein SFZ24_11745 [Planctomycetota bacterium]|nr:hypothetical protein [Planctomycetota bacterium]